MAAVSPARANALLLGVMVFAMLLLMAGSVRGDAAARAAAEAAGGAARPVVGVERSVTGILLGVVHFFRDLDTDETESRRLHRELANLEAENARSRELRRENERLRRLLGMREDMTPKSIGASVVTAQIGPQSQMIVVDRGSADGVKPDMAVVAWGGAVGRVVTVSNGLARVRLLTDPNSGAAGVVARSRAEGMVVGRGTDPLDMLYVPKYDDVEVGDRVVTAGLDGVFPRGFGIGRVSAVLEPTGASKTIRLEPEIDYRALEDVLVLLEPTGTALLAPEAGEGRP